MRDISYEEARVSTPDELFTGSRRPLPRERPTRSPTQQELVTAALIGPGGMGGATPDDRPANEGDLAQEAAWKAEQTEKVSSQASQSTVEAALGIILLFAGFGLGRFFWQRVRNRRS